MQSHHALQQGWAKDNIPGYNGDLAPTITIETNVGLPHTIINNLQNSRRDSRLLNGKGKWESTLQDELNYIVSDMESAGFSKNSINKTLDQQYKMLDKLKINYNKVVN